MQATQKQLTIIQKCRIIALGIGWTMVKSEFVIDDIEIEGPYWWDENKRYMGGGLNNPVPNFFESTDACIAACGNMSSMHWTAYLDALSSVYKTDNGAVTGDGRRFVEINAPSKVRAEALFLTFQPLTK